MSLFKKKELECQNDVIVEPTEEVAPAVPEGVPPSESDVALSDSDVAASSSDVVLADSDVALAGSEETAPAPAVVAHDDSVPSAHIVAERPAELALAPATAPAFDTVDDLTDAQLAAIHARVLHGEIIEM